MGCHLGADHGEGLTLRGVDLAGHDAAARLILWQLQLSQPTARPAAQEADVIRHLRTPIDAFCLDKESAQQATAAIS